MKTEPVLTIASITAGVTALLALLVAFGIPVTDEQQIAILGVVAVAAPFVVALIARSQVTPNGAVVEKADPASGLVVAGEASEIVTGEAIRRIGEYTPSEADVYVQDVVDEPEAEPVVTDPGEDYDAAADLLPGEVSDLPDDGEDPAPARAQ